MRSNRRCFLGMRTRDIQRSPGGRPHGLVLPVESHVSFGSDSAIGRRIHRKDAKSAKA